MPQSAGEEAPYEHNNLSEFGQQQDEWHNDCGSKIKQPHKMKIIRYCRILTVMSGMLLLLLAAGCEKVQVGEPFTCRVGPRYLVENNVMFSIDSISDYRCPEDVVCIWGGDVDLFFKINLNLSSTDTVIMLYRNNPIEIGNYSWQVLDVKPLPRTTRENRQEDYRIELLIKEK